MLILKNPNVSGAGIANFANNPEEAGKSLERCISQAKEAVPVNKHVDTPIYLGATAGMRLLKYALYGIHF